MTKDLPLRLIARVLIIKDGNVCLGEKRDAAGTLISYSFPGGGVEKGQTMETALAEESMQEVGILIQNIEDMGIDVSLKHVLAVKSRNEHYSGTRTRYFKAQFAGEDLSKYNTEGDAMNVKWVTPTEAIALIEAGPVSQFNAIRINALQQLINKI